MQAKKGEHKKHHFSHDPKDIAIKGKCTYSDETERHKIAKDILQRIKQIKVPALYKYPPQVVEGKSYKIRDAQVIKAFSVRNEISFYEDENGNLSYGSNIYSETGIKKYALIRPDITFFDVNEKPILLIELIATHDINEEKLSKIIRLGDDTIRISIPKESPEKIEESLKYK